MITYSSNIAVAALVTAKHHKCTTFFVPRYDIFVHRFWLAILVSRANKRDRSDDDHIQERKGGSCLMMTAHKKAKESSLAACTPDRLHIAEGCRDYRRSLTESSSPVTP